MSKNTNDKGQSLTTHTLTSKIDFLENYLGIGTERVRRYIEDGRANQLHRIAAKLYRRHHRMREVCRSEEAAQ
jgi:hypothetical protein